MKKKQKQLEACCAMFNLDIRNIKNETSMDNYDYPLLPIRISE